jgi:hypothetical protein
MDTADTPSRYDGVREILAAQVTLGQAGGPGRKRKPRAMAAGASKPRAMAAGASMRNAQEEPRIALILAIENARH